VIACLSSEFRKLIAQTKAGPVFRPAEITNRWASDRGATPPSALPRRQSRSILDPTNGARTPAREGDPE